MLLNHGRNTLLLSRAFSRARRTPDAAQHSTSAGHVGVSCKANVADGRHKKAAKPHAAQQPGGSAVANQHLARQLAVSIPTSMLGCGSGCGGAAAAAAAAATVMMLLAAVQFKMRELPAEHCSCHRLGVLLAAGTSCFA